MTVYIISGIILINIITFVVCAYDKGIAGTGARRVPEKVLFGLSALFGSLGMLCGMYLFRHKTRHMSFVVVIPLFFVIQTVVLLYYFGVIG